MLKLLLVRHGETDWNRDRRIMGRQEIGLNETGRLQALSLKEGLARFGVDAVYSSSVCRARETAQILTEDRGIKPKYDDRLVEIHYGDWVGMTFEEVRTLPDYTPYFKRLDTPVAPNGETLYQVRDRAMEFVRQVQREHADQTVLAVSHADWIKCVVMEFLGIPSENIWKFRIDNVSVSLIEGEIDSWDRVICVNQRGDLDRLFVTRFAF
ncbi:MAG: histidine phosphatase family protein [Deltaproteobacteria bacterium]|nr:histidine phosphatase family protein [Deltaproteobacteria bacterium]